MTIIPDAIEPYVGYKALHVHDNGQSLILASPSYQSTWPKQQRHEAVCPAGRQDWAWKPVRGHAPNEPEEEGFSFNKPTDPGQQTTTSIYWTVAPTIPDKPKTILPDGMYWSWEPIPHQIANQHCTCGIYVVDAPGECVSYIHPPASVICKIALWGTVTRATHGARGQYAYPQTIEYAMGLNNQQLVRLANEYGLQLPESTPPDANELIRQYLPQKVPVTFTTTNEFTVYTSTDNTTWTPTPYATGTTNQILPPWPHQVWG